MNVTFVHLFSIQMRCRVCEVFKQVFYSFAVDERRGIFKRDRFFLLKSRFMLVS